MKHQPVAILGDDLCNRILADADNQEPTDYGVRPGNDVYLVSWPEHVLTPKYNGDAYYQGKIGRASTYRGLARIAKRNGARPYGV